MNIDKYYIIIFKEGNCLEDTIDVYKKSYIISQYDIIYNIEKRCRYH